MLKEQIESSFYITFPKKANTTVNIVEKEYQGSFSLCDSKACEKCPLCKIDESERVNIIISSKEALSLISVGEVASFVQGGIGKNCDYLLANNKTVLFIEMTCSTSENVDGYNYGKRMTAQSQLLNTIHVFSANPNLREFMFRKGKRYAIFSWKDTSKSKDEKDKVEIGFETFTQMAEDVYSKDNIQYLTKEFILKEIRYPEVLEIEKLQENGQKSVC